MMRRVSGAAGALVLAAGLVCASAMATAQTKIRLTLDWIPQSPHAIHFIPLYNGAYKAAGLDVSIDAGRGSADAVRKLVSGTHDVGLADINALIQYNAGNPGKEIKVVMMMYEQPPFSIFVMQKSGITHPRQLVGKTLGAPVFDASYKLFPAFAQAVGIDHTAVMRKNMDPRLREVMLLRGQVDAISGHFFSSLINIKAAGYKESDIRYFLYGDYGMESYANGVGVRPDFLAENPDAVSQIRQGNDRRRARDGAEPGGGGRLGEAVRASAEREGRSRPARSHLALLPSDPGSQEKRLWRRRHDPAAALDRTRPPWPTGSSRCPRPRTCSNRATCRPRAERFIHK